MESLVVTLETAKALKAAGFPQKSLYFWHTSADMRKWLNHDPGGAMVYSTTGDYAAPTAQEIADQLPRQIAVTKMDKYVAEIGEAGEEEYKWVSAVTADTMAEALASLYLKLQEPKS